MLDPFIPPEDLGEAGVGDWESMEKAFENVLKCVLGLNPITVLNPTRQGNLKAWIIRLKELCKKRHEAGEAFARSINEQPSSERALKTRIRRQRRRIGVLEKECADIRKRHNELMLAVRDVKCCFCEEKCAYSYYTPGLRVCGACREARQDVTPAGHRLVHDPIEVPHVG